MGEKNNNRDDDVENMDDPFDDFEGNIDREGNPFENLDPPTPENNQNERNVDRDSTDHPLFEDKKEIVQNNPESDNTSSGEPQTNETDKSDSTDISRSEFPQLDAEIDRDGEHSDAFAEDDLFTGVDTITIDEDAIWDELTSEESTAEVQESVSSGSVGKNIGETVVPKAKFCQQCEYFASPPEIKCNHQEANILEFVGIDRVRVSNCPIVANDPEYK